MPTKTFIDSIRDTLADEMRRDESVIVLGEDVGKKGGVFLATDGLLKRYGEDRVVDMPIAEAAIAGVAIGASLHGLRPVAEIQFADYIHPAIDQILNEAARFRYRSNGDWSCPIVLRAPFGAGEATFAKGGRLLLASDGVLELTPKRTHRESRDLLAQLVLRARSLSDITGPLGLAENTPLSDDVALLFLHREETNP